MSAKPANDVIASKPNQAPVIENNPSQVEQAVEIPSSDEPLKIDKKEPRVIAKVDLNTVKVDVGSSAKKGDTFSIYDKGRYLATFIYEGGDRILTVSLENYLHRNTVHEFSVSDTPSA